MSDLQHIMQRIGRMAAADQMLEVVVRGTQAYAQPGRVVIPSIDRYEWLGKDAMTMLYGVLFHECGHASFTDFDLLDKTLKTDKRKGPAFKHMWNVIEDAFVEREKGAQFKGCAIRFRQLYEWFWEFGGEGNWGKRDVLRTGMCNQGKPVQLYSLFLTALSTLIRPYGGRTLSELHALNPAIADLMRPYLAEIEEARSCDSTRACLAVTRKLYDRLQAEGVPRDYKPDDRSEPPQSEPGEGDGDGHEDVASGEEGEEGEEDGERDAGARHDFELPRYTEEPHEPLSPSGALEFRVRKLFDQPASTAPYVVFSHEFDLVRDFSEEMARDGGAWIEARRGSRMAAAALTNAFEVALRATAETRAVGGYADGIPDPELLAQYAVGACPADRLFMQYERGDGDDVAVAVQLDCSGSMQPMSRGSKSWLARQAAIAISDALAPCQIAHEITGFTTVTSSYGARLWTALPAFSERVASNFEALRKALVEAKAHGTDLNHFARCMFYQSDDPHTAVLQVPLYGVFKTFDQGDARGLMNVHGLNHNLDGEAVLWQARRLALRPEKRRVLFVLSDGLPAGSRDNAQGAAFLKEAVDRAVDAGIEVYALGIQSEHVARFYPMSWVVTDLEDLTRLAVSHLCDVLLRNRQERAWIEAI